MRRKILITTAEGPASDGIHANLGKQFHRDQQNRQAKSAGPVSDKQKSRRCIPSRDPNWQPRPAGLLITTELKLRLRRRQNPLWKTKISPKRQSKIGQMSTFDVFWCTKFQRQPLFFTEIDKAQPFGDRKLGPQRGGLTTPALVDFLSQERLCPQKYLRFG